jgi:hypothetical protein
MEDSQEPPQVASMPKTVLRDVDVAHVAAAGGDVGDDELLVVHHLRGGKVAVGQGHRVGALVEVALVLVEVLVKEVAEEVNRFRKNSFLL